MHDSTPAGRHTPEIMTRGAQDGGRAAPRVVVVDDDKDLRGRLRAGLQDAGTVVGTAQVQKQPVAGREAEF